MQRRLLDATVDSLVERGYAGTTTTEVALRAGVSRGAQLHHFPSKARLVSAAIERLFAELTEHYRRAFASLPESDNRLELAVDLLWRVFEQDRFAAVIELYLAARTDSELLASLRPVALRHRDNVVRLSRELFAEQASDPRFDAALAWLLEAMHGLVLTRGVFGDDGEAGAVLNLAKRVIGTLVDGAPTPAEN